MRKMLYAIIALALGVNVVLANDFFTASGVPSTGAALVSSTIRTEFANIGAGFDKMPTLTGNGNKVVTVNAGGTALGATAATALSGMVIGTNLQAWDADLDAVAALTSTAGMLARTGAGAFAVRTITGTSAEIDVANGTGASAAPTLSLPTALTFTGKTITGGTFSSPTITTPILTVIDAAGDLIVGTAADTVGRLGIGTAYQRLMVNSGGTAIEWSTPMASQAELEAGTSIGPVFTTPGRQHFHPSAAKAWGFFTVANPPTVNAGYPGTPTGVKNSVGNFTITHQVTFSSTNYSVIVVAEHSSAVIAQVGTRTATTINLLFFDAAGAAADPGLFHYVCFGDQ